MSVQETVKTLNSLCKEADAVCALATTATRNGKSLKSTGFYADKFHGSVVRIGKLDATSKLQLSAIGIDASMLTELGTLIASLQRPDVILKGRVQACRNLRLLCDTKIVPDLESRGANPIPLTEHVLPVSVVQGTRGYLEHVLQQANGCYEHQWFDSCGVMLRKFVEILIIHVFEAHGISDRIKGSDANFFMLGELVNRVLADTSWNLGRETKACLPEIKLLGDRSAHNRTFMARKSDVDKALTGFRVAAEELLHLAKLR
jgi:hypothetical protein